MPRSLADSPSTWRQKDLLDLGKFLVLLFPPELESLPASKFNSTIFSAVLSPLLTHCQRVVLYNKYLLSSLSSPLPSHLLTALPSSTLLLLGTASSPLPSTSWDQDMPALVSACRLYTPARPPRCTPCTPWPARPCGSPPRWPPSWPPTLPAWRTCRP